MMSQKWRARQVCALYSEPRCSFHHASSQHGGGKHENDANRGGNRCKSRRMASVAFSCVAHSVAIKFSTIPTSISASAPSIFTRGIAELFRNQLALGANGRRESDARRHLARARASTGRIVRHKRRAARALSIVKLLVHDRSVREAGELFVRDGSDGAVGVHCRDGHHRCVVGLCTRSAGIVDLVAEDLGARVGGFVKVAVVFASENRAEARGGKHLLAKLITRCRRLLHSTSRASDICARMCRGGIDRISSIESSMARARVNTTINRGSIQGSTTRAIRIIWHTWHDRKYGPE